MLAQSSAALVDRHERWSKASWAHPGKRTLRLPAEASALLSSVPLGVEARPDVHSGEARVRPVSLQDGSERVKALLTPAHPPPDSKHPKGPVRLELREKVRALHSQMSLWAKRTWAGHGEGRL